MSELAREVIDAVTAGGAHRGHRALHAKGTLCAATFTATSEASSLSRAAHLTGEPMRAHVRFSNGSGDPAGNDVNPMEGRGMAVKVYLPDGTTTDIVSVTLPAFFVATPEAFLELVVARRPDPATGAPDPAKIGAFVEAHPEALTALGAVLASAVPVSYAQVAYNGLHAFLFADAAGTVRAGRYEWEPDAGVESIPADDLEGLGPDHLQQELADRLGAGPASFTLWVRLAADGDPIDDPTQPWPAERERVGLGRLEVTGIATDRERDGDVLVFDPCRVTDGIALSDDRILRFRSDAYRESVFRRTEPVKEG